MSKGAPARSEELCEARRELAELGVTSQFTSRGDGLSGEISTSDSGGVTNPASWDAIPRASFTVDADGRMELGAPPAVAGLVVDFRGAGSRPQLVARVRQALRERFERVGALRDRLQRMGLTAGVDSERLVVVTRVDLDVTGVVELEGGDLGLVARRLVPALGDRTPVPLGDVAVDLDELPDRIDVELCISQLAEKALAGGTSQGQGGSEAKVRPSKRAPKDEGPTLELLAEKLGGDAVPHPGFVVTRSLVIDGGEAAFTARLAERRKFVARLSCASERLWEGEFDLDEVTHLDEFIVELHARVVGRSEGGTARPSRRQWSDADEELVAGLLPPARGEIWVLDVQVEDDRGDEVRYRGLNIAGKPSGATRVLPKAAFESAFVAAGAGYRMLAAVLEVGADYVIYQTLDAGRAAASSPRRSPLIVFMANFTPESANY